MLAIVTAGIVMILLIVVPAPAVAALAAALPVVVPQVAEEVVVINIIKISLAASVILLFVLVAFSPPPAPRYFAIGWNSPINHGLVTTSTTDGKFISYKEAVQTARFRYNIPDQIQVTVISIYEFRSKTDFDNFIIGLNAK